MKKLKGLMLRIDADNHEEFKRLLKAEGRIMNSVINMFIRDYIQNSKKKEIEL